MTNAKQWRIFHSVLVAGLCIAADAAAMVANEVHGFNVPSEDAATAIRDFGLQADLQFLADGNAVEGKRFSTVSGNLSVDEGLRRLLAGTGLVYAYVGKRAVSLTAPSASKSISQPSSGGSATKLGPLEEVAPLEEIVVNAQRREQNLQEVPISAQVVGAQRLAEQNLSSLNDLSETTPSIHVGSNSRSANLYIRGIGSGESQTFDQSVGLFADDIYHGRARMSAATFFDLDHIEVLKGPQTTFFGNNAIAGAFNIVTKKPGDEFEASTRILYGQDGQYAGEGAVGGPLTDILSARIAVLANGMTGWLDNVSGGHRFPGENNIAGRFALLFKAGGNLDATLKVEGSRNRNIGALALQDSGCPPPAPFVAAGFCKTALKLGVPAGLDNNSIAQNSGQEIRLNTSEYVLTTNYHRWGHTFTSVSGYYDYRFSENEDTDGTPLNLLNIQAPESYHQFSEELRIASSSGRGLEYLGGLYFHTDQIFFRHDNSYFFLTPTLESAPAFAPLAPFLPFGQDINFLQPEKTYSAFGSANWAVLDNLKIGAGLRASWVKKSYEWNLYYGTATKSYGSIVPPPAKEAALANAFANATALGVASTLSGSRDDHALMPSAQVQYSVRPAAMTYFSYARGFLAGGFNGNDTTGVAANLPFAPEYVNAYEVGLKSEWFDRSVLLNLDIFRSDYTGLQVTTNLASATGAILSLVRNAATSRSQGIELQTQWLAGRNFRLSAALTYDHARYIRYPNVSPTQLQQLQGQKTQDLSGQPTEFAPDWSGTLTGSYTTDLRGGYRLTASLTGIFSSAFFLAGNDEPTLRQGSYARLDARLSLGTADGRWTIDLIGKNLTSQNILTFGIAWPTSPGSTWLQKEQPRNAAAQVRFHW